MKPEISLSPRERVGVRAPHLLTVLALTAALASGCGCGKTLKVSLVNYDSSKGLLELCLLDSTGATELACSTDSLPTVSAAGPDAGSMTVIARVAGTLDRTANTYTLKVEFL